MHFFKLHFVSIAMANVRSYRLTCEISKPQAKIGVLRILPYHAVLSDKRARKIFVSNDFSY